MIYVAILGSSARLLLALSGVGQSLAWRIEVSTAANSNLELREGVELYRLGVSPYSGSSCRVPPLALWLYGPMSNYESLYVLPNIILDLLAALLLYCAALRLFPSPGGASSGAAASASSAPPCDTRGSSPGRRSAIPGLVAWAYLLNPFTLAAAAAGTTSSLEGLAVVGALYGSIQQHPALSCLGVAVAVYMSLHNLVLLLPVACLLAYGPEDVATPLHRLMPPPPTPPCPGKGMFPDVTTRQPPNRGDATSVAATHCRAEAEQSSRVEQSSAEGPKADQAHAFTAGPATTTAAAPAANESNASEELPSSEAIATRGAPLLPWSTLGRCTAWLLLWWLLLALGSDLYLAPLPPPTQLYPAPRDATPAFFDGGSTAAPAVSTPSMCLPTIAAHLLMPQPSAWTSTLGAPRQPAWAATGRVGGLNAGAPTGEAGAPSPWSALLPDRLAAVAAGAAEDLARRLAAAGGSLGSCWAARVYGSQVLLDDATPNVGQWWYLAMEVFEDSKIYIRLLAHSLLFAMGPPLAFRLGSRRPLALFLLEVLSLGLLKPYPSVADLGLVVSLLPLLARQQLAGLQLRLLLPASLALLCVLGPAMQRMWLSYESANSNFLYSVTLSYGVWQVVLLGQVLGLTLRLDRAVRGKEREWGSGVDEGL